MNHQQMQGMYTLRKCCAITGAVKEEIGPFCNKITNLGLDRLGVNGGVNDVGYVGTGTNPSQFTDTSMGNLRAFVNAPTLTTSRSTVAPYWVQRSVTFRFPLGSINGNITEVGVGWTNNSIDGLWSRELIVDSAGNPITLTILENEFLDVIYSLRFYPNVADSTGSVVINGITYNYTVRTANINSADLTAGRGPAGPVIYRVFGGPATLGPVTGAIEGATSSVNVQNRTYSDYVPGSFKYQITTNFELIIGNVPGGITAMEMQNTSNSGGLLYQIWQMVFDKPIPKTADNTMSLTMEVGWGRYTGPIVP